MLKTEPITLIQPRIVTKRVSLPNTELSPLANSKNGSQWNLAFTARARFAALQCFHPKVCDSFTDYGPWFFHSSIQTLPKKPAAESLWSGGWQSIQTLASPKQKMFLAGNRMVVPIKRRIMSLTINRGRSGFENINSVLQYWILLIFYQF